jgi:transcriptional regulator with XRE-family HTH domain
MAMNPINVHLGRRLREVRIQRGLSQTEMSGALRVKHQDYEAIENGTRRLTAEQLLVLTTLLDVAVAEFFEGLDLDAAEKTAPIAKGKGSQSDQKK